MSLSFHDLPDAAQDRICSFLDLSYRKEVVDESAWQNQHGRGRGGGALLQFWERYFTSLKLRLVERLDGDDALPDHLIYVNDCDDYKKNYTGSHHVVFDGMEKHQIMIGGTKLDYMAVLDAENSRRRAFIGHCIGYQNGVLGGIAYFHEDGSMDGEIKPFNEQIFGIDFRDRAPEWKSLFFCGDKLCLFGSDRWPSLKVSVV